MILLRGYVKNVYVSIDDPLCRPRYFMLVIYDTPEEMCDAAHQYHKRRKMFQDLSGAAGVFQGCDLKSKYDESLHRWVDLTSSFAGIMRLSDGYLSPNVIAHESLHAAMHMYRMYDWSKAEGKGTADFGYSTDMREEDLAYCTGDIVEAVTSLVSTLG